MGSELEINKVYKPLYTSDKRYFPITGGRGSLKSHSIHDYVVRLTYQRGQGIYFTRLTMTSAETSIIPDFEKAIDRLGVRDDFTITKRDIINKKTGSYIWFRGLKASSGQITANQKSLSGITTWIVEEAEDLQDEELFDKIDDSIRGTGVQNRVILVLNPTTREHWIYRRWFEHTSKQKTINTFPVTVSDHPQVEHIHSTYLIGLNYLSPDWLIKAKRFEDMAKTGIDPDNNRILSTEEHAKAKKHYINNYLGGWLEKAEGVIFDNWIEEVFPEDISCVYGQDYGENPDPTTLIKLAIDERQKKIYVKTMYRETNLSIDEIYKLNLRHAGNNGLIIADNNPLIMSSLKKKGLNMKNGKIKKVVGTTSILAGIKGILDYTLCVDPSSHTYKKELNNYIWSDKRSGVPIDDWNHEIDPTRYCFQFLRQKPKGISVRRR